MAIPRVARFWLSGFVGIAFALPVASAGAQMSPPVPREPPANCTTPEHRQFDFWVGQWDVYKTGTEELVARSLIEKLYGDCAIRENWSPFSLNAGGSLSNYDRDEKAWRQSWVDSYNNRVDFKGGVVGEKMVLTGLWKGINGPGKDGLVRMTYSREPAGAVRQIGEVSTDGGAGWSPSFDFTYQPANARKPQQ